MRACGCKLAPDVDLLEARPVLVLLVQVALQSKTELPVPIALALRLLKLEPSNLNSAELDAGGLDSVAQLTHLGPSRRAPRLRATLRILSDRGVQTPREAAELLRSEVAWRSADVLAATAESAYKALLRDTVYPPAGGCKLIVGADTLALGDLLARLARYVRESVHLPASIVRSLRLLRLDEGNWVETLFATRDDPASAAEGVLKHLSDPEWLPSVRASLRVLFDRARIAGLSDDQLVAIESRVPVQNTWQGRALEVAKHLRRIAGSTYPVAARLEDEGEFYEDFHELGRLNNKVRRLRPLPQRAAELLERTRALWTRARSNPVAGAALALAEAWEWLVEGRESDRAQRPWDPDDPDFVSLTEVVELYRNELGNRNTLGKRLRRPGNRIPWMTQGRRTRIRLADAHTEAMKVRQAMELEDPQRLEEIEARKQAARQRKRSQRARP